VTYTDLNEALRAGWQVYDKTTTPWTLRKKIDGFWVLGRWDPVPFGHARVIEAKLDK
jgi:hypothetical protein